VTSPTKNPNPTKFVFDQIYYRSAASF